MKGFGAGARLWELMDRQPEFPLNGQYILFYYITDSSMIDLFKLKFMC